MSDEPPLPIKYYCPKCGFYFGEIMKCSFSGGVIYVPSGKQHECIVENEKVS